MLSLFVILPLAGILILNMPFGKATRNLGFPCVFLLAALQIVAVAWWPSGSPIGTPSLDHFLGLGLKADGLAFVLLLTIGIVLLAAMLVGHAMISGERQRSNFANVLLLSLAGMNGTVLLTDLFSFYVFLEVTSVSSFILIAFERRKESLEGAFKYLVLSAVATVLMLSAVGILLLVAGGTSYETVAAALRSAGGSPMAKIAVGAFVCGLFIKGGLVPFHGWLPGAYSSAPASVSVLLAGIVTKVSGIYGLLRLTLSVFPPSASLNEVLLLAGAISIAVGALAAMGQTDMKGLLAYSSISQVGYIVLGLGCGTKLGIAAAILHLFNHSIFKSLLFVNAAAVEQRSGTTDMTRIGGLGPRMPVTGVTNVIAALSTAGVPPFSGFWSKLGIVIALWQTGRYGYAGLAVLFSVVTLSYLLTMQRQVFFGKTPSHLAETREATLALVVPAVALAAITLAVGLLFPWLFNTFLFPAGGII